MKKNLKKDLIKKFIMIYHKKWEINFKCNAIFSGKQKSRHWFQVKKNLKWIKKVITVKKEWKMFYFKFKPRKIKINFKCFYRWNTCLHSYRTFAELSLEIHVCLSKIYKKIIQTYCFHCVVLNYYYLNCQNRNLITLYNVI